MPLSADDVRHVALLARLGLEPGEEDFYAEQLAGIIDLVDRLQEVDVEDIPPTAQVVPLAARLRADEPRAGLTQEQALAGAPEAEDGFYVVKAIQDPEP
ncbi:MAG: Asp-tRNA(Asn)/Glu-tRNA(Gln) amidotransferase subunit GatC [Candidatus Dormiibacterota bacterium]